jgi:GNAT superfamily N-acetyltransferase
MMIRSGKPSEIAPSDKAAFIKFVSAAGEVDGAILPGLVDDAVALAMLFDRDKLVGTAAIKTPYPTHRRGEFAKANVADDADAFPLELGWVVVHPEYRNRGHAPELVHAAVRLTVGQGIYATTKTPRMLMILAECGFRALGDSYPSILNPDAMLTLLVRPTDNWSG